MCIRLKTVSKADSSSRNRMTTISCAHSESQSDVHSTFIPLRMNCHTRPNVRGPADMDRILVVLLLVITGVAGTNVSLTEPENVAGKLVFYQMEGNATCVRDTGKLASDVPTQTMLELFDPQMNLSNKTKFAYTWDLGNGEVIQGTEPVVRYSYPVSGNYTLRLKVRASVTEHAPFQDDVYSSDLSVLDAVKHIELEGPSDYVASENSSLAFHVDGSPPKWACWRFLPHCVPDATVGCRPNMLYENTLRLNHTFTSAGVHCLDVSVRNDISNLQTSFSLNVKRSNNNHIFFILSCAAVLVATFSFIGGVTCRPRHHRRFQMSSNVVFLKNQQTDDQSLIHFNLSNVERGERKPLLLHCGHQYSS